MSPWYNEEFRGNVPYSPAHELIAKYFVAVHFGDFLALFFPSPPDPQGVPSFPWFPHSSSSVLREGMGGEDGRSLFLFFLSFRCFVRWTETETDA